jgi:hypothetical protein
MWSSSSYNIWRAYITRILSGSNLPSDKIESPSLPLFQRGKKGDFTLGPGIPEVRLSSE